MTAQANAIKQKLQSFPIEQQIEYFNTLNQKAQQAKRITEKNLRTLEKRILRLELLIKQPLSAKAEKKVSKWEQYGKEVRNRILNGKRK